MATQELLDSQLHNRSMATRNIHSTCRRTGLIIGPVCRPTGSFRGLWAGESTIDESRDGSHSRSPMPAPGIATWLVVWSALIVPAEGQQLPPDATWMADATLDVERSITDLGLGAVQGVVVRDRKVYAYGDVFQAKPRVGVIREYTKELEPTGRVVWLRRGGKPLLVHPTGLTWHDQLGDVPGRYDQVRRPEPVAVRDLSTGLGASLEGRQTLMKPSWRSSRTMRRSTAAAPSSSRSAAAPCWRRPTTAISAPRSASTTLRPCWRPAGRARRASWSTACCAGRSTRTCTGTAESGHLICVQNVIAGRGWQLDELDLARAVADGRADGPGVRVRRLTFPAHDELEGYWGLASRRGFFAVARRHDNLFIGTFRPTEPRPSPPNQERSGVGAVPVGGRPGRIP